MDIYTLEFSIDPADLAVFKKSPIVITRSNDNTLVPAWISFIPTIPVSQKENTNHSSKLSDKNNKPQPLTYTISFSPSKVVYGFILSDPDAYKSGLLITQQFDQEVDFLNMKFDGNLFKEVENQDSNNETEGTADQTTYNVGNQSSYPNMLFGLSSEPLFTGNFRILKPGIKSVNAQYINGSVGTLPTDAKPADSSLKRNIGTNSDDSQDQFAASKPAKFTPTETISVFTLPDVISQELLPTVPKNAATFTFSKNQSNAKATFNPEEMVFVIAPS